MEVNENKNKIWNEKEVGNLENSANVIHGEQKFLEVKNVYYCRGLQN